MPHGIVECWNTGYEKRKKVYSTKNVVSTFYDDARQTSIFCFCPRKYVIITRNQYNYIRFDSLNPTFHQSKTHDSAKKLHCVPNIPEFQHSNRTTLRLSTGWGEAPKFSIFLHRPIAGKSRKPVGRTTVRWL